METVQDNILNVTLLEPRRKHPAIFERFDALNDGEALTILNDHDPKPLYYQLLGERGNIFKWEYLEEGPEWWKVCITKNATGTGEETLGQIAAKDLRKAEIFKKYGLDFCCGGKKTVKEACLEKGLDVTRVEQELQQADKNTSTPAQNFDEWNLGFLADYIVNTHHQYVRKQLPEIRQYAAKVMQVHGNENPELVALQQLVEKLAAELLSHLEKEENILFPFIKQMVSGENLTKNSIPAGYVQSPIKMMETEHEAAAEHLNKIRSLSNNYSLPETACASYGLLFRMLQEFENDLHIHVHLENNILFPKALAYEKRLN